MCYGMCPRENRWTGECRDPSRCLMEARERAEEQTQGEAAANRLAMLRRAYATRHAVEVVLIDSLTDDGPVHGVVAWIGHDGRFALSLEGNRLRVNISPTEIGARVFIAGPWPENEEAALDAGDCPACGETLQAFPASGVVACPDCDWGMEIPPAARGAEEVVGA